MFNQGLGADGNLEILDFATALRTLFGVESKCDRLRRCCPSLFERLLAPANYARLVNVKVPGSKLLIEIELDRDSRLSGHEPMLQERFEFLQRDSKISCYLAQLAIS